MYFRQPNLANELFCSIWEVALSVPCLVREGALSVSSLSEGVLKYIFSVREDALSVFVSTHPVVTLHTTSCLK